MHQVRITLIFALLVLLLAVPVIGACTSEKVVEVPVEKVVEKEVIKEVPVEKVVVKEVPIAPIKVGIETDLTGVYGATCTYLMMGARDHFEWYNQNGGVRGVQYDVLWGDSHHEVAKALSLYEDWKARGAKAALFLETGPSRALKDRLPKDDIVGIDIGTDEVALYPPGWVFGTWSPYDYMAQTALKWIKDDWDAKNMDRPAKVTYLGWDHPSGRANEPRLADGCKKYGFEFKAAGYFPTETTDFTTYLSSVDATNPDYFLHFTGPAHTAVMLKNAYEMGIKDKYPIIMTSQFEAQYSTLLANVPPEVSDGWMAVSMCTAQPWELDKPGIQKIKEFQMNKYGSFKAEECWGFYAVAWCAAAIVHEGIGNAIDAVGYDGLNGTAIKEGLESIKGLDIDGLVGEVSYSDTRRHGSTVYAIGGIQDGKPVILSDLIDITDLVKPFYEEAAGIK